MTVFESQNYRSYLKKVLVERQKKNRAYSLRALARDLNLKPSHLSAIHHNRKSLSVENAYQVADRLGLVEKEREYFCLLVQLEQARSPQVKDAVLQKLDQLSEGTKVRDLNVDLFKTMSEWYHIPILELTEAEGFEFTALNIAKRLGITALEAELAIERLERLEMLEKAEDGTYRKVVRNYVFKSEIPNAAIRNFHQTMLEKAKESLHTQTPQERYVGSETLVINPARLNEAAAIIERCRKDLIGLLEEGPGRTEAYHLGVQFFRITKKTETKETEK